MSDWLKFLQTQLTENPGKPLKEVIEIAKIEIKKIPEKNKSNRKKKSKIIIKSYKYAFVFFVILYYLLL